MINQLEKSDVNSNKRRPEKWVVKSMRLLKDTEVVLYVVKSSERFTENELIDYFLAGILYLHSHGVKFTMEGGIDRQEVYRRLIKYYDGNFKPHNGVSHE